MLKSTTTFMATLAFIGILALPTWADSNEKSDDEYVSTENIDQPFGEPSEDYTESHTRVFPLVKYDREGEDTKLKVLHVPFVAAFKSKKDEDVHKVEVVDVPFFKLAQTESRSNGEFDNKFVKLPIVGSLFRHKRQGDREKIRFLIFSHTKKVDPEEYGNEGFERQSNQIQSRGKGVPRRN